MPLGSSHVYICSGMYTVTEHDSLSLQICSKMRDRRIIKDPVLSGEGEFNVMFMTYYGCLDLFCKCMYLSMMVLHRQSSRHGNSRWHHLQTVHIQKDKRRLSGFHYHRIPDLD